VASHERQVVAMAALQQNAGTLKMKVAGTEPRAAN
jgi:hypothetical protein